MKSLIRPAALLSLLLVLPAVCHAEAAGAGPGANAGFPRPGDPGQPTTVYYSLYLVDILSIDDMAGTITLYYSLNLSWNDPSLADANFADPGIKSNLTLGQIWHPDISLVKLRQNQMRDERLLIDANGNVSHVQRRIDTFSCDLDLGRFPFDRQTIQLEFLSAQYSPQQLDLRWARERSGQMDHFSLHGWEFRSLSMENRPFNLRLASDQDHTVAGFGLGIVLKREATFYVWKVFFPLALIVFMAWTVFWIDPANLSGQLTIASSAVITLIAFQLSLVQLLPRISYLTKIDVYTVSVTFLVFLALGESIVTARLAKSGRHQVSLRIDKWMRYLYPAAFLLLLLVILI